MVGTARLEPASWMSAAPVKAVFDALGAPDVDVRFVGGCVRDAVLSRPIKDIDIATPDEPARVVEKLANAGLKAVPTGLAHGTVTAVAESQPFEITTLRKDTACDGRYAAVEFTTDWVEDASRRDFTFNALSLRLTGHLFDPFGGVEDAYAGRVRFVGDPRDRIQEDYLRILRFFRFVALYGSEEPDLKILAACRELRSGLGSLSTERVRDEMVKLLNAPDPIPALTAMDAAEILYDLFPETAGVNALERLIAVEQELELVLNDKTWRRRWLALFDHLASDVAGRMKISGKDSKSINALCKSAVAAADAQDSVALNRFLYEFADASDQDCPAIGGLALACARDSGQVSARWSSLITHVHGWSAQKFPLRGVDVQSLGVEAGPQIGALLREIKQDWVDGGCVSTTSELRAQLKSRTK
ncbi:MAG: CCA tRNA nucleotidyltransferase [Rhodospirillaceae bacterium]|nr:CCA tRNA nucleotidyltransferase [Rhodospirillaceae bacterium]